MKRAADLSIPMAVFSERFSRGEICGRHCNSCRRDLVAFGVAHEIAEQCGRSTWHEPDYVIVRFVTEQERFGFGPLEPHRPVVRVASVEELNWLWYHGRTFLPGRQRLFRLRLLAANRQPVAEVPGAYAETLLHGEVIVVRGSSLRWSDADLSEVRRAFERGRPDVQLIFVAEDVEFLELVPEPVVEMAPVSHPMVVRRLFVRS